MDTRTHTGNNDQKGGRGCATPDCAGPIIRVLCIATSDFPHGCFTVKEENAGGELEYVV